MRKRSATLAILAGALVLAVILATTARYTTSDDQADEDGGLTTPGLTEGDRSTSERQKPDAPDVRHKSWGAKTSASHASKGLELPAVRTAVGEKTYAAIQGERPYTIRDVNKIGQSLSRMDSKISECAGECESVTAENLQPYFTLQNSFFSAQQELGIRPPSKPQSIRRVEEFQEVVDRERLDEQERFRRKRSIYKDAELGKTGP
jgi:hypothetical protein